MAALSLLLPTLVALVSQTFGIQITSFLVSSVRSAEENPIFSREPAGGGILNDFEFVVTMAKCFCIYTGLNAKKQQRTQFSTGTQLWEMVNIILYSNDPWNEPCSAVISPTPHFISNPHREISVSDCANSELKCRKLGCICTKDAKRGLCPEKKVHCRFS